MTVVALFTACTRGGNVIETLDFTEVTRIHYHHDTLEFAFIREPDGRWYFNGMENVSSADIDSYLENLSTLTLEEQCAISERDSNSFAKVVIDGNYMSGPLSFEFRRSDNDTVLEVQSVSRQEIFVDSYCGGKQFDRIVVGLEKIVY